jgi:hypothetical protein
MYMALAMSRVGVTTTADTDSLVKLISRVN